MTLPSRVVVAKNVDAKYTTNGGTTWTTVINDAALVPLRLIAVVNNTSVMLLGRTNDPNNSDERSIWRSASSGSTWGPVSTFTYETNITDFSAYPRTGDERDAVVWACGSDPNGSAPSSNKSSQASIRGLFSSADYGYSWVPSTLGSDNLKSVAIIPKSAGTNYLLYAAASISGGNDIVYKSTDLGGGWSNVFSSANDIRMIRAAQINSSTYYLYLATDNGVHRSTNEGTNWTQLTSGFGSDLNVLSIAIDAPHSTLFAGTANSLYKSTDNGATWTNVGDMDVSTVAAYNGTLWAGTRDNNYTGKYTGSWTRYIIDAAGTQFSTEQLYRNPNDTYIIYASGAKGTNAFMYKSIDGGVSYSSFGPSVTGGRYYGSVAHPTLPSYIYLFGGATYSGGWKNFFSTTDNGSTWSAVNVGSASNYIFDCRIVDVSGTRKTYVALNNGTIYRKVGDEAGFSNVLTMSGAIARTVAINSTVPATVYAAGSTGLWKSTNSGDFGTWTQMGSGTITGVLRAVMHPSYPSSANYLWVLSNDGNSIYKTTNGGTNWSSISLTGVTLPINNLSIDPQSNALIYAATPSGVFKINPTPEAPYNLTIRGSGGGGGGFGSYAAPCPTGSPILTWSKHGEADVASGGSQKVYRKLPNESSFTLRATVSGTASQWIDDQVIIDCDYPLIYYKLTEVDNGGNESDYSNQASVQGYASPPPPKTVASTPEDIPEYYELAQNHPNPFNPVPLIRYALPEDVHVTLKVYDVIGREVAILADEFQTAGYKLAEFDASNLPSGIYFYKLTAGKFTDIKKMMLVQ